jgi:hypothetical protein
MAAHNKQKKEITKNDRAVLDGLRPLPAYTAHCNSMADYSGKILA